MFFWQFPEVSAKKFSQPWLALECHSNNAITMNLSYLRLKIELKVPENSRKNCFTWEFPSVNLLWPAQQKWIFPPEISCFFLKFTSQFSLDSRRDANWFYPPSIYPSSMHFFTLHPRTPRFFPEMLVSFGGWTQTTNSLLEKNEGGKLE